MPWGLRRMHEIEAGAMPLTAELRNSDGWVRRFLDKRFSLLGSFVRRIGVDVKSLPVKVEPHTNSGLRNATIGKALDYRLRLHYGWDPSKSKELDSGVRILAWKSGATVAERRECRARGPGLLAAPIARSADTPARASIVLAWLDDLYRGNRWPEGLNPVVDRLKQGERPDWAACAAEVDRLMSDEVRTLMEVAAGAFRGREAICGPGFASSAAVGGADADFVVEGCPYEVKTTKAPREKLVGSVRQLLGYVLLDWSDDYKLQEAWLYFARQGHRMSWPLAQLLSETTGDPDATLAGLRDEFRRAAENRPAEG